MTVGSGKVHGRGLKMWFCPFIVDTTPAATVIGRAIKPGIYHTRIKVVYISLRVYRTAVGTYGTVPTVP